MLALGCVAALYFIFEWNLRFTSEQVWRGIESDRATGLSAVAGIPEGYAARLLQSFGEQQITRAASLGVTTRDFDRARAAIEKNAREPHGYVAESRVAAQKGAGRTFTAVIHVPASELDVSLDRLRALGQVERESQAASETGAAAAGTAAKLAAARATEQRLDQLVRHHPGKLEGYLEVEKEIAKVRGEIEDLEAKRKTQDLQVQYAALEITLNEEYAPRLDLRFASILVQLRSSLVEGLQSAFTGGSAAISLTLRYGPTLLFWGLLLYWPGRYAWRRLRASRAAQAPLEAVQ